MYCITRTIDYLGVAIEKITKHFLFMMLFTQHLHDFSWPNIFTIIGNSTFGQHHSVTCHEWGKQTFHAIFLSHSFFTTLICTHKTFSFVFQNLSHESSFLALIIILCDINETDIHARQTSVNVYMPHLRIVKLSTCYSRTCDENRYRERDKLCMSILRILNDIVKCFSLEKW
jgi:hypothetical protein